MSARKKARSCGKRRFRSELDAKIALATIERVDDPKRAKLPQRAYSCPLCGGAHLTSQPQRTERAA